MPNEAGAVGEVVGLAVEQGERARDLLERIVGPELAGAQARAVQLAALGHVRPVGHELDRLRPRRELEVLGPAFPLQEGRRIARAATQTAS